MRNIQENITYWKNLGLTVHEVRPLSKIPAKKGYVTSKGAETVKEDSNIAIRVDAGYCDVDLDCPDAIYLANHDNALPHTGLTFGRESYGKASHWFYKVDGIMKSMKWEHDGVCYIELRSGGKQLSTVPPSVLKHKHNTETIENVVYYQKLNPSQQSPGTLIEAAQKIAVACHLARYWTPGKRQDLTLALAGGLARAGYSEGTVKMFLNHIHTLVKDDDPIMTRWEAIRGTYEKFNKNEKVSGFNTLKKLMPEDAVNKVIQWLDIKPEESPIFQTFEGMFLRGAANSKGIPTIKQLTNFSIAIKNTISLQNNTKLLCVIDTKYEVVMDQHTFNSSKNFKTMIQTINPKMIWLGSDTDLQHLARYLGEQDVPNVTGVDTFGFHLNKFITNTSKYKDVVYVGDNQTECALTGKRSAVTEALKKSLTRFNAKEIALPILGWTAACFFKDMLIKEMKGFPILFISGEAGAGKTRTARDIIYGIWGINKSLHSIGGLTYFTQIKLFSNSYVIPEILDEYKPCRMPSYKKNGISEFFRTIYNASAATRGKADQSITYYPMINPLCVCGEDSVTEKAHVDRMIMVDMYKEGSLRYVEDFNALICEDLSTIGDALIELRLRMSEEEFKEMLGNTLSADRAEANWKIVEFGLKALTKITGVEYDISDTKNKCIQSGEETLDAVTQIMMEFNEMARASGETNRTYSYGELSLVRKEDWDIAEDKLYLYGSCYPKFKAWAKRFDFDGDMLTRNAFLKQVQKRPYYTGHDVVVKVEGRAKRCLVIDLKKIALDNFY